MTYDQRRETARFVWRKIRFAFTVLDRVDAQNDGPAARSVLAPQIAAGLKVAAGKSCAKEVLSH
jgi:hypothetical protein